MRIKEIISQYRNDFSAVMECEHCGNTQNITTGYDDANYHRNVIPVMTCLRCGKNRAGVVPQQRNDFGTAHVSAPAPAERGTQSEPSQDLVARLFRVHGYFAVVTELEIRAITRYFTEEELVALLQVEGVLKAAVKKLIGHMNLNSFIPPTSVRVPDSAVERAPSETASATPSQPRLEPPMLLVTIEKRGEHYYIDIPGEELATGPYLTVGAAMRFCIDQGWLYRTLSGPSQDEPQPRQVGAGLHTSGLIQEVGSVEEEQSDRDEYADNY